MPDWLKAIIAGYTAKKLGGGCLSTILIFFLIYFALGQCHHSVQGHVTARKPASVIVANLERGK
jgi:hypothetical protein